jgi:hypothetical protein
MTRERERGGAIPELCGPFPEAHHRLGRLNGDQFVPCGRGGLPERMAQQCEKAKDGKTISESEPPAVMFQGIERKRSVCGLRHFIKGHKDS